MSRLGKARYRLVGLAVVALVATGTLATAPASAEQKGANAIASSAVTATKTVDRTYTDAGTTTTVDKRDVSLTVGTTTGLKSLQQIQVSWSGAHPTNGFVSDLNSDYAQNEEYSMALFECRGVDSTTVPVAQQLSPQTCWTQYGDERFQGTYDAAPAWRSDVHATAPDRAAVVDSPDTTKLTKTCQNYLIGLETERWVRFDATDGTDYAGGPRGCAGQPPEAAPSNNSSLSLPSNETFGVTSTAGTGSAAFDVFTAEDHASLGCSQTVPCSLVAIPIEGISCDDAGSALPVADRPSGDDLADAKSNCETAGNFTPGENLNNQETGGAAAVDGTLWWSASNWQNRIVVPLSFATPDDACSIVSSQAPVEVYGSELLSQATTSWSPHFCLNSALFDFKHVQTPEPEARNLLQNGSIQAAFASQAPATAFVDPTVQAPTAVTGFGIAYDIDNDAGQPVQNLKLDPRLLAKLMTESYPSQTFVQSTYPKTNAGQATLSNNPINLGADPEFQALNPGIPAPEVDSAATLLLLNSSSDVIHALTAYINADPEARAWLNGAPDPWGMRVNPNYQNIALPVDTWPLLDSYEPLAEYQVGKNDCLSADPTPYLPLVASPTAQLFSISQDMQFALSQSQTTCSLASPIPGDLSGAKLVANGREAPGHQFMLGLVSLGDAARAGLSLASLESQTTDALPAGQFTTDAGRVFAAPTQQGLKDAVGALTPDAAAGLWDVDYATLRTDPAQALAYPGTMVVYSDIPTSGLTAGEAKDYSELLTFVAGAGQEPGPSQGQLPDGFLPMTSADGMSGFVAYTKAAALDVAEQSGQVPLLTTAPSTTTTLPPVTTSDPATANSPGSGPAALGGDGSVGGDTSSGGGNTASNAASSPTGSTSSGATADSGQTYNAAATSSLSNGAAAALLPAVAVLAVLAAGAAVVLTGQQRRRSRSGT